MDLTPCPQERDLVAWVAGGAVPDSVRRHLDLDECGACKLRVDRLRAELSIIRDVAAGLPPQEEVQPTAVLATAGAADCDLQEDASEASSGISDEEDLPRPERNGARPESIGRFRVVGELDPGGQALVYRAIHPTLPRDLAIKIAHRPSAIDRSLLRREAEVLCELDHSNLVRVYDLDVHEGCPFVVMEFVRGPNFKQVAEQSRPSPHQAAAWVADIARALEYIHRRRVVHQDIKPSNIMLDETGRPRLIDFGMARWRHAWSDDRSGPSGGTLAFMAPEQARGESERVGPSSDIFALGGVLYFLLTGQVPFEGRTRDEQWRRAMNCDFDRSALRTKQVPRRLENIVLKAMAADQADRFTSAEALARSLNSFVRRPYEAAVASLVLLFLGAAMGASIYWSRSSRSDLRPIVIQTPPGPQSALAGEMTLRVWSPGKEGKRGWKIGVETPQSLPVRRDEMIHIEAKLNQPAYVYLLWLDGQGKITPLYPWIEQDFSKLPAQVPVTSELHNPPQLDKGWPVEGPSGLETILMLARLTPLSPGTDLAAEIGALPPAPLRNPLEIAVRGFDIGQPTSAVDRGWHRGPAKEAQQIDEPLLQLLERLRPHFDFTRAVRFAYQGQ
jgi:serine/threonine protein kinase